MSGIYRDIKPMEFVRSITPKAISMSPLRSITYLIYLWSLFILLKKKFIAMAEIIKGRPRPRE
jgi:hypothetical protein